MKKQSSGKATPPAHDLLPGGLKFLDILIMAAVLCAAVFSGIRIYGNRGDKPHLVIEAPSGTWIYDLDRNLSVEIPGSLGNTTVEIRDGNARIIASPCPNKTCVAAQEIDKPGEWNACLPNKVIIRMESASGTSEDGIDAIAE